MTKLAHDESVTAQPLFSREQISSSGLVKRQIRQTIAAVVLLPITMTALDSDGDILPDAWEDSHSMDKNDHEDASIDFDRDRLSALEEFQLQAEGLGEGPLGK